MVARFWCGQVEQRYIQAHAPVRTVTRAVSIIFAADLNANRLFTHLKNLLFWKMSGTVHFASPGGVVPVGRGFRTERESSVSLEGVGNERLKKKLAESLSMIFVINRPELIH